MITRFFKRNPAPERWRRKAALNCRSRRNNRFILLINVFILGKKAGGAPEGTEETDAALTLPTPKDGRHREVQEDST